MFPYMMQRIKRQPLAVALLFLLNFVAALLLCILHGGSQQMSRRIGNVYQNAKVSCYVSNLTGTQSDGLTIPEWVIHLFVEKDKIPGSSGVNYSNDGDTAFFQSYLEEVQVKTVLTGQCQGGQVQVAGITGLAAEPALLPESGCTVTWQAPYDETIFSQPTAYCLLPAGMQSALTGEGTIQVILSAEEGQTMEFLPVGTHTGPASTIYCAWQTAAELSLETEGTIRASAISATFRDSSQISTFWASVGSHYFAEPNAQGRPTPWEDSMRYTYYPFSLVILDDMVEDTIARLENNLLVYRLCTAALVVLTPALNLVGGQLVVRNRVRILARCSGSSASQWTDFCRDLVGAGRRSRGRPGRRAGGRRIHGAFPWVPLSIALAFSLAGISSAIGAILHRDLVKVMKEDA